MGRVLAVLNRKGGVGKTTVAVHVGRAAAQSGLSVLLVDADPQGTLRDWHAAADGGGMQIIAADTPTALASIPTLKSAYDIVVIDGNAGVHVNAAAAVRVADGVLVPVQPSGFDVWSTNEIVDLIKARRQVAGEVPAAWFVLNRVISRSVAGRAVASLLPEFGLPVLDSQLAQRVGYASATSEGRTALDVEPAGSAAHEVRSLYREIEREWA